MTTGGKRVRSDSAKSECVPWAAEELLRRLVEGPDNSGPLDSQKGPLHLLGP